MLLITGEPVQCLNRNGEARRPLLPGSGRWVSELWCWGTRKSHLHSPGCAGDAPWPAEWKNKLPEGLTQASHFANEALITRAGHGPNRYASIFNSGTSRVIFPRGRAVYPTPSPQGWVSSQLCPPSASPPSSERSLDFQGSAEQGKGSGWLRQGQSSRLPGCSLPSSCHCHLDGPRLTCSCLPCACA